MAEEPEPRHEKISMRCSKIIVKSSMDRARTTDPLWEISTVRAAEFAVSLFLLIP